MQANWIGKSKGCEIDFEIFDSQKPINQTIKIFTTRPDTIFEQRFVQYHLVTNLHYNLKQ